jgi:LmbE family N-acetylglucosaminyl deacetylase
MKKSVISKRRATKRGRGGVLAALAAGSLLSSSTVNAADDGKLRIICFGAHPDDCEIGAGGTAVLWAKAGHHVKFVSVTNGDIGHWREAGGPLFLRRKAEVEATAKMLGVTVQILDNHDGELEPTLENRRKIIRLIREWQADLVISHRPNDYHPDHRYTGILVQDAAYMVTVPFICPDVPPLKNNPVFMYSSDGFLKPNPFAPDVAVSVDEVMEKKLEALGSMISQFAEGGANGSADLYPADPAARKTRDRAVRTRFEARQFSLANQYRSKLNEWYGPEAGAKVRHAEVFEVCEYGRRPEKAELAQLFPFLPKPAAK